MAPANDRALLVCVYYRVGAADSARAISIVREFQRTLRDSVDRIEAEVLLRCGEPPAVPAHHAPPPPVPSSDPAGVDITLMETYRLTLPASAGEPAAQHAARVFLDALAAAARPLAGLLRGARHVELFAPCAS